MSLSRRAIAQWGGAVVLVVSTGLAVAAWGRPVALAAPAEPRFEAEAERRAARRRWALRKMDEMANEALRCRERFSKKVQVESCVADFTRRFREFNELYLESSPE